MTVAKCNGLFDFRSKNINAESGIKNAKIPETRVAKYSEKIALFSSGNA